MLNFLNKKSESEIPMQSEKTTITKKLFASLPVSLAFIIMMMFSFTFVNAQDCPAGKFRIYKCSGISFGCNSRCAKNIPNGWSIWCPCEGRLANEQAGGKLFTLAVSPNPVSGSSVIYFFLEQPEKASINIFDVNGRLITTLADKMFEEGENEIIWEAADVNAGIYFLRMETADYSENQKLIVTR